MELVPPDPRIRLGSRALAFVIALMDDVGRARRARG
jgi:hypothetical protein